MRFARHTRNGDEQETGDTVDDAQLVRDAQSDPRRFAALYDRYVDPVYRYCYRRLGNSAQAEDATSAVFFKALVAVAGFDSTSGSFRSWLFAIAHNVVIDQARLMQRRPETALNDEFALAASDSSPEELVLAADERSRLDAAVMKLPADQQRIIELRRAGLTGPEIAGELGRSQGAIRVAQHRAIGKLRALLDDAPDHIDAPQKETRRD